MNSYFSSYFAISAKLKTHRISSCPHCPKHKVRVPCTGFFISWDLCFPALFLNSYHLMLYVLATLNCCQLCTNTSHFSSPPCYYLMLLLLPESRVWTHCSRSHPNRVTFSWEISGKLPKFPESHNFFFSGLGIIIAHTSKRFGEGEVR